jgi:hypothetical protein
MDESVGVVSAAAHSKSMAQTRMLLPLASGQDYTKKATAPYMGLAVVECVGLKQTISSSYVAPLLPFFEREFRED